MYYFDDFFYIYLSIILTLSLLVLVLAFLIYKIIKKSHKLEKELKTIRKISDDMIRENANLSKYDTISKTSSNPEETAICLYRPFAWFCSPKSTTLENQLALLPLFKESTLAYHETNNESVYDVKFKYTDDTIVKEERMFMKTTYSNHPEVESKIIQQISDLTGSDYFISENNPSEERESGRGQNYLSNLKVVMKNAIAKSK